MTISAKTVAEPFATTRSTDASATNAAQLVIAGTVKIQVVDVDNTANSAKTYLKVYDAATAGAVTVGTTVPAHIFMVPPGVRRAYTIPEGLLHSAGIVYAALTAGGTAGTTSPTNPVPVRTLVS
jgi:hypothetical protein